MATRDARLDFRLDPDEKSRIEQGICQCIRVRAATTAADQVLAQSDVTMMSAEQFDDLLSALAVADAAPALAQLGKRERRYLRK